MADVELTITFKNGHVDRIVEAVNELAEKRMFLMTHNLFKTNQYEWQYDSKQSGETMREYGERFLKEFVRAFVRCYELAKDKDRWDNEVSALDPVHQDVPDEIVE